MYLYCIPDYDCIAVFVSFENEKQFNAIVEAIFELQHDYQMADFENVEFDTAKQEVGFIVQDKEAYKTFKEILDTKMV